MIFETLHESSQEGELMLVDGGMCHWHLWQDDQLTIREIISYRPGAGSQMLERLRLTPGATSLFAKCPAGLEANAWYSKRGFYVERMEVTKTGRKLLRWRLDLREQRRRPNVANIELIYCAAGNREMAEIAIDHGWRYGAQLPAKVYYRPYFIDQDFENPDREKYMAALAKYRPHMATVLDWQHMNQLEEVLSWSEEAAQYVSYVVIIPKVPGEIGRIPERVGGKPVRLGYSVKTKYASTPCQLYEFGDRPVHLLGGSFEQHMALIEVLNVWSIDTNYHMLQANSGRFFAYDTGYGRNRHWPTIKESFGVYPRERKANLEAFRLSCITGKEAIRQALDKPKKDAPAQQLVMWTAAWRS